MGLTQFKALESKRKKDEDDKKKTEASKPLLTRGVQSAPNFSAANIKPPLLQQGIQKAPQFNGALKMQNQSLIPPNQSTPQGQRFAAPPTLPKKQFQAPAPAPQSPLKASSAIFRPQPNIHKQLTQPALNAIKPFGQMLARGSMSTGAAIAGVPGQINNVAQGRLAPIASFTPVEPWEQALFGTKKPISFQSSGEELGIKNPALATGVGVALSLADLSGTGAVSKHISLKGIKALVAADDIKFLSNLVKATKAKEVIPDRTFSIAREMLTDYYPKLTLPASKTGLTQFLDDAIRSADNVAEQADFVKQMPDLSRPATKASLDSPAAIATANVARNKKPVKSFLQRVNEAITGKFKWVEPSHSQRGFIKNPFFLGDDATESVARHVSSSRQVITELGEEGVNKLGGMEALLKRTKVNIIDALKAEGKIEAAAKIEKLQPTSLDDFARTLRDSERGFFKNPFARAPSPPKGTASQLSPQSPPSPKGKPLSDLTPEQSLSLSNDIDVFNANKVPEVNLSKLAISSKGKELIKQTADEIRPRLEQLIGKPLSNKEVLEQAQFSSKTLRQAITKEQTKKWEVALTATRQKLAAMADSGVVDRDFIETLETVRTVASDAGRKLQAFSIEAKPAEITVKQHLIENMLDLGHKAEDLIKAAEGVDFNNMKEAAKYYRQFVKPTARELIDTLRYNSMLSSPLTHIVNIASNLINTTFVAPVEKALAGGVDFLSSKVTGKAQQHFAGESGVYLKAYAGSVREATDKFIQVMRGAAPTSNLDLRHIPLAPQGGVPGALESSLSVPMKLLEGMDQFFMTLGNAAETASMQYKASKGLKVTQSDIALQASKKAAYRVFRQELFSEGQGGLLNAVDTFTQTLFQLRNNKNPLVAWTVRMTVPFVQTPMNIFKQGLEYSPAGYFTMIGAADKSAQLTKAIMGSTVAAMAGLYAANGRLSWAEPTNEAERNAFRDAGKQPYSIKMGDNWVSYQKLPPVLAFPISMIALTHDSMNQQKLDESTGELILRSFAKYAQFMSDQSYAKSFGDLLGAFSGSESDIARLASNYPQQFVPFRALTAWLARLTDDVQRKPDPDGTFVEKQVQLLMMNYPGLSKQVPARVNEKGEEIKVQHPTLNAVSPFRISTEDPEKAAEYSGILDIKKLESDASARNRVITDQAEDMAITYANKSRGEQRRDLRKLSKDNPALAEKVQDILDKEEFEYTGFEKKLKDATTDTRAQMILKQLKGMDKTAARKLKNDYKKRKIITDSVEKRMREIERDI